MTDLNFLSSQFPQGFNHYLEAFHIYPFWMFTNQLTSGINASLVFIGYLTRKHLLTYNVSMMLHSSNKADVFGAISHPARRHMLDLLARADSSVNVIAGHFEMSRPAVSQHLRILLDAGLVVEQRYGRERRYHLVPEQLAPVRDWIAHYEHFWDERFIRLQKHLSRAKP